MGTPNDIFMSPKPKRQSLFFAVALLIVVTLLVSYFLWERHQSVIDGTVDQTDNLPEDVKENDLSADVGTTTDIAAIDISPSALEEKISALDNVVKFDTCESDTGLYILYTDTTLSFLNTGPNATLHFSHQEESFSSEIGFSEVFDITFTEPDDSILVFCDGEEMMEIEVLELPDEELL